MCMKPRTFQFITSCLRLSTGFLLQVHLFIHIPTGVADVTETFFLRDAAHLRLNNIKRKYNSGDNGVILGVYGTHVHSDSFKMYYENGTGTLFSVLVPGSQNQPIHL